MIKFKHILVSSIVAIMLLHTAIPHNHYAKLDSLHSIEHNQVANIVDVLGLGFHHSSQKDLNESNQVSNEVLNLADVELTAYPLITKEVTPIELSSASVDYTHLFIKHYKFFYSNKLPLRAPPKEII